MPFRRNYSVENAAGQSSALPLRVPRRRRKNLSTHDGVPKRRCHDSPPSGPGTQTGNHRPTRIIRPDATWEFRGEDPPGKAKSDEKCSPSVHQVYEKLSATTTTRLYPHHTDRTFTWPDRGARASLDCLMHGPRSGRDACVMAERGARLTWMGINTKQCSG